MAKSLFLEELGDSPRLRVIEFFIEGRGLDHAISDVAYEQKMKVVNVKRQVTKLLAADMLRYTRMDGHAKLYRVNEKNDKVKEYIRKYDALISAALRGMQT